MIIFSANTPDDVKNWVNARALTYKPGNKRQVYGVGINDVNSMVSCDLPNKKSWKCPLYRCWQSMLQRCYSDNFHSKCPTYIGCSVCDEWHRFSVFRAWMLSQDWDGKSLDKDILFPGNKVYSPDTCVFVTSKVNTFFIERGRDRGEYMLGVSLATHQGSKPYAATCSNPDTGKQVYLGYYPTEIDAHNAWKKQKHQFAVVLAETQADPRVRNALLTRYL